MQYNPCRRVFVAQCPKHECRLLPCCWLLQALHQLGLITSRALAAMDLPEGTAQAIGYTFNPETYFGSSTAGPATGWPARLATWQKQLRWGAEVAVAGIRSFAEDFWERWGAECVMLLLLTAAFVGVNAVSLLFLLLVVLGMAAAASQAGGSSRGSPVTSGSGSGARRRGSGDRLSRGNSSTARSAGSSRRHSPVSWWWWHLVLGVLVVVLVSGLRLSDSQGIQPTHPAHVSISILIYSKLLPAVIQAGTSKR